MLGAIWRKLAARMASGRSGSRSGFTQEEEPERGAPAPATSGEPLIERALECAPCAHLIISGRVDARIEPSVKALTLRYPKAMGARVRAVESGGTLRIEAQEEGDPGESGEASVAHALIPASLGMRKVTLSGSATLYWVGPAGDLELVAVGSGSARLHEAKLGSLRCSITGSADISAWGSADLITLSASGSGKARLEGLPARRAVVSASGAAEAHVNAEDSIEASASGSAEIKHEGNAIVRRNATGMAQVIPARALARPRREPS